MSTSPYFVVGGDEQRVEVGTFATGAALLRNAARLHEVGVLVQLQVRPDASHGGLFGEFNDGL
jgi:hypothetical protein